MPKLKVFRTTIGFHDAYVAGPSRAAALRAWGASTDLFAIGAAEEVTEPTLMKKPLANPGVVVKQSRGTAADHMAASETPTSGRKPKAGHPTTPKPLPSRRKLDAAEKRLADAEAKFDRAKNELDNEAARLASRRRAIEQEHEAEIASLKIRRYKEEAAHREALETWRASSGN